MKNPGNQQCKSQFREVLENISILAFLIGSIVAYIGFVFDFTIMFACSSMAALTGIYAFIGLTDKRTKKGGAQ